MLWPLLLIQHVRPVLANRAACCARSFTFMMLEPKARAERRR